jgi:hypothetical protein
MLLIINVIDFKGESMKILLNLYFEIKYGIVYAPKPPLGFSPYSNPAFMDRIVHFIKRKIWEIDCFIDDYAGKRRKQYWYKEFITNH